MGKLQQRAPCAVTVAEAHPHPKGSVAGGGSPRAECAGAHQAHHHKLDVDEGGEEGDRVEKEDGRPQKGQDDEQQQRDREVPPAHAVGTFLLRRTQSKCGWKGAQWQRCDAIGRAVRVARVPPGLQAEADDAARGGRNQTSMDRRCADGRIP